MIVRNARLATLGYSSSVETDLAHYRRRAAEEYLSYANSSDPRAREVHLKLAERYEELTRALLKGADDCKA